jgi:hypothetical protein
MIATALRVEIERYAQRARHDNPLFWKAEAGSLTAACIAKYLANLHHLLLHTPACMTRARHQALQMGAAPLASHFAHKLGEEDGHDAWAEHDIDKVSAQLPTRVPRPEVLDSMHDLVSFIGRIIDEDPCLYLSYLLFVENLTVLLGPEWLRLLEDRCGIPCSSMTVVKNHADLDREHVEEALDTIDALVADPQKLPRMREVLLESMAHFDRFCAEITQEARDTRAALDAASHVSAA